MDIEKIENELLLSREYVQTVEQRLKHNEVIAEYFELLAEETGNLRYVQLADDVFNCNRSWGFDRYDGHKVYDLVRVVLCHSRFCSNCQKMIQSSRLHRFAPVLERAITDYDLYHVTFTVPNVPGVKLRTMIRIMARSFKRLIRFLKHIDNIKDLSFSEYGFYGCLRNLEVTFNNERRDYHPHYHCIFALKKGLDMPKLHVNEYSFDLMKNSFTGGWQKVFMRNFSDFEILLQKLWRALVDQERVKAYKALGIEERLGAPVKQPVFDDAEVKVKDKLEPITNQLLNDMRIGYSCVVDPIDTDADEIKYYEVFKYAFKLTSDEKQLLDYEQFKTLYFAFKGARTMQGYGAWYNLKGDEMDDSINEFYSVYVAYLRQSDDPARVNLTPAEVGRVMDEGEYKFMTRRGMQRDCNKVAAVDLAEIHAAAAELPPEPPRPRPPLSNFALAYSRYLQHKRTSPLFREYGYATDPDSGRQIVVLSFEQLSFFPAFFR